MKHWKSFHPSKTTPPKFTVKILSSHKSATERQISEAIAIEESDYDNLLNSKSEWGMNAIPRQKTVVDDQVQGRNKPPETANASTANSQNQVQRAKRSQENDPPDPGSTSNSTFSAQLSQRRKRARLEMKEIRLRDSEKVQDAKEILADNARQMRQGKRKLADSDLSNAICQGGVRLKENQNGQNTAQIFEGTQSHEKKKTRTDFS